MTDRFDRSISMSVKGIAILMMMVHHCFAFPDFWMDGFTVSPLLAGLADHFKICVAMFAFITGYGFFHSGNGSGRKTMKKVLDFMGQYWLELFLIFLPIACTQFRFSIGNILLNVVALGDHIVLFSWYVFFHLVVLLTFPLVRRLLQKDLLRDLLVVLVGGYGCTVILYFLPFGSVLRLGLLDCSTFYPVVGMGYLAAKYRFFDRISQKVRFHVPAAICLIVSVFLLRSMVSVVKGFTFDVFYAPVLLLALMWLLEAMPALRPGLTVLGRHSFHMWLFHSIFFSAYTRDWMQPLVSWSDLAVIRCLLVTGISLAAAWGIDTLWKYLSRMDSKSKKSNI